MDSMIQHQHEIDAHLVARVNKLSPSLAMRVFVVIFLFLGGMVTINAVQATIELEGTSVVVAPVIPAAVAVVGALMFPRQ